MGRNIGNLINELRELKYSKKTLNRHQLAGFIHRAGYKTKLNGGGHFEIYRSDGTRLMNDKIPFIFSNQNVDLFPGHYKKIINAILEEIEEYSPVK